MYIGAGAGEASDLIMAFIEVTRSAFVAGPMGKTWVDETHPLYRGVYGFAGHESAEKLFQDDDVDLILAVGATLGELETGGWNDELLNSKLVHIDSAIEHFTRSPMANLHVFGNLTKIFEKLLDNVTSVTKWGRRWVTLQVDNQPNMFSSYANLVDPDKCLSDAIPIKPQRIMYLLSTKLSSDTRVFVLSLIHI